MCLRAILPGLAVLLDTAWLLFGYRSFLTVFRFFSCPRKLGMQLVRATHSVFPAM